ncbi:hypothetical protein GCM10023189_29380 [Nibrella saemangeumensis]|uniref:NlpC/P60 domain-containing protein n=1 Tax=Nibrella saemangeumensis TaxID=1084526 RepID=A0ABP8N0E4_9BACT
MSASIQAKPTTPHVTKFAHKYVSVRYVWGGSTPRGFDCSGFTKYCFQRFGIRLPRASWQQGKVGVSVKKEKARPGDLIFFRGKINKGNQIQHVGIVTEVKKGRIRFIHSITHKGVRYDWLSVSYYQKRLLGIRRVIRA